MLCQVGVLGAGDSKADDGVLINAVVDAGLAQLFAELGVVCDVNALIVDHNAGDSLLELCLQLGDSLLLFK